MVKHKVVYDSQDEDEGLSPIGSPANGSAVDDGLLAAEGSREPQVATNISTDPEFFQRIYEEQRKSAPKWVPDSMRHTDVQADGSSGAPRLEDSGAKAKNNSSSITDPTLKSAKKRALGNIDTKDFGNLTQVTTPSAPSTKKRDVYDFSLSEEEGAPFEPAVIRSKRKAPKSAPKRKREQSAAVNGADAMFTPELSPAHDNLDLDDESPQASRRKKRKSLQDEGSHDVLEDVDLLIMPDTAEMSQQSSETKMDQTGPDNVIPDTFDAQRASNRYSPAAFFIEPPDTLTSSQKQEYLRVSGESELDRHNHLPPPNIFTGSQHQEHMRTTGIPENDREDDEQQPSLPHSRPANAQPLIPLSGTQSTVAFTAPSRFASSVPPLPLLEHFEGRSSNGATSSSVRRSQAGKTQIPTSSPDELSTHVVGMKTRGRRPMSEVQEEDESAQHDSRGSDNTDHSREANVPRSSRRRLGPGLENVSDAQTEGDNSTGRKKGQEADKFDETTREDSLESDEIGFQRERYVPRPSKRRSRAVIEDDEDEVQQPEQSMPDTCPPGDFSKGTQEDGAAPIAQQAAESMDGIVGVDPDVWAALPDEIRQELRSQQPSQAPRSRRSGRSGESSSILKAVQEEPPQPKKRGRKKKEPKIAEEPVSIEDPTDALNGPEAPPSPAPTTTAKRKRGRPKKSDATQPPSAPEHGEIVDVMEEQETTLENIDDPDADTQADELRSEVVEVPKKPPAKRGRKKKIVEEPLPQATNQEASALEDGSEYARDAPAEPPALSMETEDRRALRDISNTASNAPNETQEAIFEEGKAEKQQEVTPEPKAKDVPRSASTPGQQGKAPLRVGLSKKSRIPSLLKIIRK